MAGMNCCRLVGSGRKLGIPNKKTAEFQARVEATGLTPKEVMIDNMRYAYAQAQKAEAQLEIGLLEGIKTADVAFDVLLDAVKKVVNFRQVAQECAADVAPYVHSRLAAVTVQHSGKIAHEDVTAETNPAKAMQVYAGMLADLEGTAVDGESVH
jgi:hypothetical protein